MEGDKSAGLATDGAASDSNSKSSSDLRVWVLGGGISGLATAAALRRRAHLEHVTVLECLSHKAYFSEEAGAVAKVGPNGLRALAAIDPALPDRVLAAGAPLTGIAMIQNDEAVPEIILVDDTVATTGLPQILIRWSKLRQLLRDLLPADSIVTGVGRDVCGYAVQDDGTVWLVNKDGESVIHDAANLQPPHLIVAADGIHSAFQSLVRLRSHMLKGPDAAAIRKSNVHDNGRVNVNAVVDTTTTSNTQLHSELFPRVPPGTALAYANDQFTCFCAPAGGNNTSWALSLADTVDETGSLLQYFAKCHGGSSSDDSRYLPAIHAFLRDAVANSTPPTPAWIADLIAATPPAHLFVRRSQQLTLVGPTFVSHDGKVVLTGDAAHASSPSYGQSASFALEDAIVLALAVEQQRRHASTNNNNWVERALHTYSELRVARCEEMFRRSAVRVQQQRLGAKKADDVLPWINRWEVPELK